MSHCPAHQPRLSTATPTCTVGHTCNHGPAYAPPTYRLLTAYLPPTYRLLTTGQHYPVTYYVPYRAQLPILTSVIQSTCRALHTREYTRAETYCQGCNIVLTYYKTLGRRTPSWATLDPSQRIWLGASQPLARALKLVSPWLGWVRVRLPLAGGWPPLPGADQP